jgi:hypothetical protein
MLNELGNKYGNILTKVDGMKMLKGIQEAASPKFPAEPATVVRSGEALIEPIKKERCVYLAENVGDGILSNQCP